MFFFSVHSPESFTDQQAHHLFVESRRGCPPEKPHFSHSNPESRVFPTLTSHSSTADQYASRETGEAASVCLPFSHSRYPGPKNKIARYSSSCSTPFPQGRLFHPLHVFPQKHLWSEFPSSSSQGKHSKAFQRFS